MLCNKYPVQRQRNIVQIQLLGLLIYLFYVNLGFKTALSQSGRQNVQPSILKFMLQILSLYCINHMDWQCKGWTVQNIYTVALCLH